VNVERPGVLVLGARNLGGAVVGQFMAAGWRAAAVARSRDTLQRVRKAGAIALEADAADADELAAAVDRAGRELGRLDAIVNAVSASRPPQDGGPFGGGALADAAPAAFEGWTVEVARQAFTFLSVGGEALRAGGAGGTLVQVTGGSARRASPGRGLWAAGAAATRALTHAAAQELRGEDIHVALLVVDGVIGSPKTAALTSDMAPDAVADQDEVARAAVYLATQDPRAMSHELTVTPGGDRWVP
jgi:NAD(P)-dependent dehydrogenase (short-subunit alcohol dehydrogenase family)